ESVGEGVRGEPGVERRGAGGVRRVRAGGALCNRPDFPRPKAWAHHLRNVSMTADKDRLGGIIHVYQKYDPVEFPSPTAEPPDLVSPAMEHLLTFGSMRELTEEEL